MKVIAKSLHVWGESSRAGKPPLNERGDLPKVRFLPDIDLLEEARTRDEGIP